MISKNQYFDSFIRPNKTQKLANTFHNSPTPQKKNKDNSPSLSHSLTLARTEHRRATASTQLPATTIAI